MNKFKKDFKRITSKEWSFFYGLLRLMLSPHIRYLFYCRLSETSFLPSFLRSYKRFLGQKYGLEFDTDRIGEGLYIGHPFNITINREATLGENCNIHKGVTIGSEARGSRKGVPTIGSKVWIGANATVVGNINIGSNVLIAPNSFVNCDVPDNSIVIGNPCRIIHNPEATKNYIIL